jgi:magnesium chelatase subunit I
VRPQLLDRFGLSVEVRTPSDIPTRVEVIKRRDAYERQPEAFHQQWKPEDLKIRQQIEAARKRVAELTVPDAVLEQAAALCLALGTDGLRGELTLLRAARAWAALEGRDQVGTEDLRAVAPSALRHRLRRNPLDDTGAGVRIERAMADALASPMGAQAA